MATRKDMASATQEVVGHAGVAGRGGRPRVRAGVAGRGGRL
jgi:hypothetical protein